MLEQNDLDDVHACAEYFRNFYDKRLLFSICKEEGAIYVHCPTREIAGLLPHRFGSWLIKTTYNAPELSYSSRATMAGIGTLIACALIIGSTFVVENPVWFFMLVGAIFIQAIGIMHLRFERKSQVRAGTALTALVVAVCTLAIFAHSGYYGISIGVAIYLWFGRFVAAVTND